MTLTVEIRTAHREHALVVPSTAVRETADGTPTLLTVKDGEVVSQPVAIGMEAGGKVEILQGVQAGTLVVITATTSPGARVRPRVISASRSEAAL
jgi:multidrug efflux pump subunit AcrA (membrane-fusion protein)